MTQYQEDVALVGDYPILYRVTLTNYPANLVESTGPFIISIVDPCDAPFSVIGSALTDQEYTITQAAFPYTIPAFNSDPSWCDISYSYTITDISGDPALTFDPLT